MFARAIGTIPLKEVAVHARPMDDRYIAADGMDVTRAFIDYAAPLVGALPTYASLSATKAKPTRLTAAGSRA